MKFLLFILREFKMIKCKLKNKVIFGNRCIVGISSEFEGYNKICENVVFTQSYIGQSSYIGNNSIIQRTYIGKYTSIASDVKIVLGNHPISTFVSTHPAFYSLKKQVGYTYVKKQLYDEYDKKIYNNRYSTYIGNDVWIGVGVTILEGVKIGDGAIIATGSIVTKDIEPYTICAGIPCIKKRLRFTDKQIKFLLGFKWWNKEKNWIHENISLFENINFLYERYNDS